RQLLTVSAFLSGGQLVVQDRGSSPATITLDHSGSDTLVDGHAFADSAITNGIAILSGSGNDTIHVFASVKDVTINTLDGLDTVNLGLAGLTQQIQGKVTVTNPKEFTTLNVNDFNDLNARNVTMGVAADGFGTIDGLGGGQIRYHVGDINFL